MLSPKTYLAIWEAGHGLSSVDQLYLLLQAIYPEAAVEQFEQLTVGQCNARLLALMRDIEQNESISLEQPCPACNQLMAVDLTYEELLERHKDEVVEGVYQSKGYHILYRHARLGDMAQAAVARTPEAAKRQMVQSCLEIFKDEKPVAVAEVAEVAENVITQVAEHIEQQDPLALIEIGLQCADCAHEWTRLFVPYKVLWSKVDQMAKHLLREIAKLTRNYGWTEEYILGMSAAKRAFYVELVDSGRL